MFDTEQEKNRLKNLKALKSQHIDPYPYKFSITHTIKEAREGFDSLSSGKTKVKVAGRLMAIRGHGKSTFANIEDETGKIQLYFKKDSSLNYDILKFFDTGDIIGCEGTLFKTRTEEITIFVDTFNMLAKSLHPLPEKWHGLQDKEKRYRERELDLIMNPEVKEIFLMRSNIISETRNFLDKRGFIEVETPVLQSLYGGAFATPFETYYKALDRNFYLRISDELYLKRLIIGGFHKVYELGKDFRNEGLDRFHNPEFTFMELYEAYSDYNDMMDIVEELFEHLLKEIKGSNTLEFEGKKISFKRPWKRIPFFKAIQEKTGISCLSADRDFIEKERKEIFESAKSLGIEVEKQATAGKILEAIFSKTIQPDIIEPTFVIDYPKDISPLAKSKRGNDKLVERFEPIISGMEIGNAFSELNDPIEQLKRFKLQQKLRDKGAFESQPLDESFLASLEFGMPPTGGLGLGIDRIIMLFTNSASIRDIILFPQLRT